MAQVRRPVPFRTRKLRPGTAMVLHPRGCGRVARRRIHRHKDPRSSTTLPGVPSHTHETRQKHAPGLGKKCGSYRACHDRPAQPLLMPKPPSWASTPTPNRPRPAPHDNTKRQVTIALPRDQCEPSRSRGRVMVAGITHIVYAVGCGEGPHSVY